MDDELSETVITKEFVGDPFVDSGLMAIKLLADKEMSECREETLRSISDELVELYLTPAWSKELLSIFPNSSYIQFSKNYNREKKSKEFLHELIEAINKPNDFDGYCVFCGSHSYKRKDEKPFVKTHIPLVGSSDFTNFFPSFNNGIDVCARCALAVQFAPILFYKTGGKPSCISCNNSDVLEVFGKECIDYISQRKVTSEFDSKKTSGIFDEGFKSPQNALFHLAYKLSNKYKKLGIIKEREELVIYRIDNYNQNPAGVSIYKLPNNVFRFVISVMKSPDYKKSWYELLSKHYRGKQDEKSNLPMWKTNYNTIHDYLLKNQSILWVFRDNDNKKPTVPWEIVERYMELVRNMNKQRVEAIKNLADKVAVCIEDTNNKKRVNDIISAKDFSTFRNQLRLVFRDWQKAGGKEPMVTYDEYVSTIIPDDYSNWRDVQDLIIIRLYEKLHHMLATEKDEGEEE